MSKIGTPRAIKVTTEIKDKFKGLPLSTSAAVKQSVINANNNPILMIRALQARMTNGNKVEKSERVSYTRDQQTASALENLVAMIDLSEEEVVRLCMEAYINTL
ncbi:hypothetical protein [Aquabacterium sp.]|uniref:hypothetical protein n=1 Tax=Aquabacterium sp. TaxID=1872578 RepID=UPI00248973C8|nr:hypothetical protein [Aquabacterium sp.]MDI1348614.1 hypothetical protein [Aquabacterium sp.]